MVKTFNLCFSFPCHHTLNITSVCSFYLLPGNKWQLFDLYYNVSTVRLEWAHWRLFNCSEYMKSKFYAKISLISVYVQKREIRTSNYFVTIYEKRNYLWKQIIFINKEKSSTSFHLADYQKSMSSFVGNE